MISSKALLLALALVAVHSVISYPVQVDVPSDVMSLEEDYLKYLFETVKDSERGSTSNGEINLLPEGSKAFSNMVQCAAQEMDTEEKDSSLTRRTLKYSIKGISPSQEAVAFHLIIPTSSDSGLFKVSVYTEGSEEPVATGTSEEKYIDLDVEVVNQPTKFSLEEGIVYKVTIAITSPDGQLNEEALSNILCSLRPMLVMYSYDSEILKNLFYNPDVDSSNVFKRNAPNPVQESISLPAPYNSVEEMAQDFCQKHTINLTSFEYLRHDLHAAFEIESPAVPTFSFCYGHCQSGNEEEHPKVTRRARLLRDAAPDLEEAGIAPCCVPTGYEATGLTFSVPGSSVLGMHITQNHVTSCGCI